MNINRLKKFYYHVKHRYITPNNIVMAVALVVAAGWAWGSVSVMQRNYALQRDVDAQQRQQQLLELEVANMQYQQNYYKSDEYKDLAARQHLGLASPGEKVLILPSNSQAAKQAGVAKVQQVTAQSPSNFEQWIDFFLGNGAAGLQK